MLCTRQTPKMNCSYCVKVIVWDATQSGVVKMENDSVKVLASGSVTFVNAVALLKSGTH